CAREEFYYGSSYDFDYW
nr:immunoglobulin heavy chain junction region [Mus musculus]MBK4196347.1 immunoglobulin heavy chain junction region [Mus musculus]